MPRRRERCWRIAEVEGDPREVVDFWERRLRQLRRHISFWVPQVRRHKLIAGRWTKSFELLYPGYVFVDCNGNARDVEKLLDVRFLRIGCRPAALTAEEVKRAKRCVEGEIHELDHAFDLGDDVELTAEVDFPFAGMRAKFAGPIQVDGGLFARIAIEMSGERIVTNVPYDYLLPHADGSRERRRSRPRSILGSDFARTICPRRKWIRPRMTTRRGPT